MSIPFLSSFFPQRNPKYVHFDVYFCTTDFHIGTVYLRALSSCSSYHLPCPSPWMSSYQFNISLSPLLFSKARSFLISILSEIPSFPQSLHLQNSHSLLVSPLYFALQIQTQDLLFLSNHLSTFICSDHLRHPHPHLSMVLSLDFFA